MTFPSDSDMSKDVLQFYITYQSLSSTPGKGPQSALSYKSATGVALEELIQKRLPRVQLPLPALSTHCPVQG